MDNLQLKLQNFRCHTDRDIELPSTGLVLLSGSSGAGKSSILNAIYHAFYGKVRKPYTYGKKTCSVHLTFDGLSITRSNTPNRVLVSANKSIYENEAAQELIDKTLRVNADEFTASAYSIQNLESSIITLPPERQLKMVQVLAFGSSTETPGAFRKMLKTILKKTTATLSTKKEVLEDAKKSVDNDPLPKKPVVSEDIPERAILEEQIESLTETHDALVEKMRGSDAEERTRLIRNVEKFKATIESLDEEIANSPTLTVEEAQENFNKAKSNLIAVKKWQEYEQSKERFEDSEKDRIDILENEIKRIKQYVLTDKQKESIEKDIAELDEKLVQATRYHKNLKRKKDAEIRIKSLYKKINKQGVKASTLSQLIEKLGAIVGTPTVCPSCECDLVWTGDELVLSADKSGDENIDELTELYSELLEVYSIYTTEIEDIEDSDIDSIKNKLSNLRSKLSGSESNQTILERNEHLLVTPPPHVIKAKKSLEQLLENAVEGDVDQSRKEYKHTEKILDQVHKRVSAEERREQFKQKLEVAEEKLRNFLDESIVEKMVSDLCTLSSELNEKREQLQLLKDYDTWKIAKRRRNKELKSIKLKEEQIKELETKVENLTALIEQCKKAEMMTIRETVDTLNHLAKVHLDRMFDIPIQVRIHINSKRELSTTVEYQGYEYDSIRSLSGGERQRCNLAFLLAANEYMSAPILMLDECLNNLDSETNTDVLEQLKAYARKKLILVVSHEAISGVADHIIKLD